ncbi:MAG: hypothetical protein KJO31_04140, partial [Gammaproteobacteria bacterium]|nr:hypothetical protein [Gammaproteobacteria bacterium]
MTVKQGIARVSMALAACLILSPAQAWNVNKSVSVDDGAQSDGESTVNGSISVGSNAVVTGSLDTVNGTIRIASNARIEDAQTVNGSLRVSSGVTATGLSSVNGAIRIGESCTVAGEVSVVNGKITLDRGTEVADDVSNVNGEILLEGATVGGDLSTVNGDVSLHARSRLKGDLIVEKPSGWGSRNRRKPRIVIGEGSAVDGTI